jgi:hypothetical protein
VIKIPDLETAETSSIAPGICQVWSPGVRVDKPVGNRPALQQEVRPGRSQIIEDSDGNVKEGADAGKHGWPPDAGSEANRS